jgi:hypothetical protein
LINGSQFAFPPLYCLRKNIAGIVAFPKTIKERPVNIFANGKNSGGSDRITTSHWLQRSNKSDLYLLLRMEIEFIFFEYIVPLTVDKFAENLVLRRVAFPFLEGGICGSANLWLGTIDLVENVTDGANECERGHPMDPPALKVFLFLQKLEGDRAVL